MAIDGHNKSSGKKWCDAMYFNPFAAKPALSLYCASNSMFAGCKKNVK